VVCQAHSRDNTLGMGIDDSLTQEIVHRLLGVTKADRIILFGSAASGAMTRDSDIDLLVVSPTSASLTFALR